MITIRKLQSLPRKTRLRKTVHLLEMLQRDCVAGRPLDVRYLREMAELVRDDERLGERLREAARVASEVRAPSVSASPPTTGTPEPPEPRVARETCRAIDALRNALLAELGREPAEWDLLLPEDGGLDRGARRVRDFFVYLEDLRSPYNVGAVFRTAESFGVRAIYLSPDTPRPDHPRAARSSMGATGLIPWRVCALEEAIEDAAATAADSTEAGAAPSGPVVPIFALETGGRVLGEVKLPEPGMVVLGSEELGVSPPALSLAEQSAGRVSIPMAGAKASLNVSVAFGILAYAWWSA
ncbi:MAG: TrmH family RNA methyltransferase [Spirochaetes bacterium]|jgi:TrmH family RNA methyltransferase|nr:TrmH family RNA methyltransferase [Spirochaetota bacterium]